MKVIAHIETVFGTKFGVPRQAGIVDTPARIVFTPEYRKMEAVRGLEDFDYIWLIWEFSESRKKQENGTAAEWSPTVRPPRLGGNQRMGVFATRSPFRPNALGLSSVRLEHIEQDPLLGPVLHIRGADLMDGTPIFDIKPYLPYTDSHAEARSGFAPQAANHLLNVSCPPPLLNLIDESLRKALIDVLAHDPRPQYQNDPSRVYGMNFGGWEIHFLVDGGLLKVTDISLSQPNEL